MDWKTQCSLIPDGVNTLSKMPSKHVPGVYPAYIDRGKGAYVWSGDKRYIDFPCGLGAILLGYADERVNAAVLKRLQDGNLFSLPHKMEGELAEKVVNLIPCAEKVRFLKTGSEATSAAVKIARAYTGRDVILCSGYHGWHDWYTITTPKKSGIPKAMGELCYQFKHGSEDYNEFFDKCKVAAVIIEPYVYGDPPSGWLKHLSVKAKKHGALLIFDEVVTGFRTPKYSAQAYYGITPDLSAFGKAAGNGYPVSWVCGKGEIMEVLQGDCFVSSTFGGDLTGMAAALAVIEACEKEEVIQRIWRFGTMFQTCCNNMFSGLDTVCRGHPCRTFFDFPTAEHKSLFWQECIKRGILFGHAQFINSAMDRKEIEFALEGVRQALKLCKKHWDNPAKVLEGPAAVETFRMAGR